MRKFSEKIANAFHHGAAGALVYNNVEGSNPRNEVEGDAKEIPPVFISKRYGEAKAGSQNYLCIYGNRPSPEADQLSDFSSWE